VGSARCAKRRSLERKEPVIIRRLVTDYEYIHTGLGICGNVLFVVGSVLFFETFSQYHRLAVWCFVIGSTLMLIGAVGSALEKLWQAEHRSRM
jgi:hypothetical protein